LGQILLALWDKDDDAMRKQLEITRKVVHGPLAAASRESYNRAYPYCVQLHMLEEIEQMHSFKFQEKLASMSVSSLSLPTFPSASAALVSPAAAAFIGSGNSSSGLQTLLQHWDVRLSRSQQSFRSREQILSLRRVLFSIFRYPQQESETWLKLAKEARANGQLEYAAAALLQANSLGMSFAFIEQAKLLRAKGQTHAALLYLQRECDKQKHADANVLTDSRGLMSPAPFMNTTNTTHSRSHANTLNAGGINQHLSKMFLLLGTWVQESNSKESKDVIKLLKDAIDRSPKWEAPYFQLGKYYDQVLLKAVERERHDASTGAGSSSPASTANGNGRSPSLSTLSKCLSILHDVLHNYILSLVHGDKTIFQSLPRTLTLWLDYGEHWETFNRQGHGQGPGQGQHAGAQQSRSGSRSGDSGGLSLSTNSHATAGPAGSGGNQNNSHVSLLQIVSNKFLALENLMSKSVDDIKPYQWLTCLPQILSRLGHSNDRVYDLLKRIIVRVFQHHPQQALWAMAGPTRSTDVDRSRRAKEIIQTVKRHVGQSTKDTIQHGLTLFDQLVAVCNFPVPSKRTKFLSVQQIAPSLHRMASGGALRIIVPVQSALTVTLPAIRLGDSQPFSTSRSSLADATYSMDVSMSSHLYVQQSHSVFPDEQVMIHAFEDTVEVLRSKEKPRKLIICGSDGKNYMWLCKKEERGDMRKNSRTNDFNTVINRLLKADPEAKKRDIQLRTYAVLPLTEDCGILEWVHHTTNFRALLTPYHNALGLPQDFVQVRQMYEQYAHDKVSLYRELCIMFPPVFHKWFLDKFPDPSAWFDSRLLFARTAAAWSIVGWSIGLGDRHGENVLVNVSSGECVHVDFDCLFDKGKTLSEPEVVPFRLTPNIVDAFGVCKTEGLYRKACEVTMQVLMKHHETLMSVLHTFIHDPLVEWRRGGKNRGPQENHGQEDTSRVDDKVERTTTRADAVKIMEDVEMRLKGQLKKDSLPMSTTGVVHALIEEATTIDNLSKMYIGWMPWL
jgi:serine/threonine-protein kinase ATR